MKSLCFLLLLAGFCNSFGQQHQYGNMYLHYTAQDGDFQNIEQEIKPLKLAKGTFWALTFGFNETNNGGYIGIQTDYNRVEQGLFIFSIWDAVDSRKGDEDSYLVDFGGEGEGKSCRISIPLQESHNYRLSIKKLESDRNGTFWGAWIIDVTLGETHYLGAIKTEIQTTLSGRVSNFVEYFADQQPCDKVPFSKAIFMGVKFNFNSSLGTFQREIFPYNYNYSLCVKGTCVLNAKESQVSFGGAN